MSTKKLSFFDFFIGQSKKSVESSSHSGYFFPEPIVFAGYGGTVDFRPKLNKWGEGFNLPPPLNTKKTAEPQKLKPGCLFSADLSISVLSLRPNLSYMPLQAGSGPPTKI